MPNLGIMASAISGRLWEPQGAYDALSTVTVPSGGVASITFAAIPTGYKHLQIRAVTQSNRGTYGTDDIWCRINNDTGSNYTYHFLAGDGSAASAGASTSQSRTYVGNSGTSTGSTFGANIIDILDYASTSKNKTLRTLAGTDINGLIAGYGGSVILASGLWMNSSTAISSIQIYPNSGTLWTQYSQFSLYGVK